MIGTLVTTVALMAVSAGDFADRFKVCEYHYTGGSYHNELFRYRLLVPPSPKSGKRYPLLVWLHGAGEGGKDNRSQLRYFDMMIDNSNHVAGQQLFLLRSSVRYATPLGFANRAMLIPRRVMSR